MERENKQDNEFASSIYSQYLISGNFKQWPAPKTPPPKMTTIPDSREIEELSKMETKLSNSP